MFVCDVFHKHFSIVKFVTNVIWFVKFVTNGGSWNISQICEEFHNRGSPACEEFHKLVLNFTSGDPNDYANMWRISQICEEFHKQVGLWRISQTCENFHKLVLQY